MDRLFVGIDVSKGTFSAAGLTDEGVEVFLISGPMDATGYASLAEAIRANCYDFSHVVAAMESTGCYHITLYSFLLSAGITTRVINPLLISNFAKLSLRKTKTDKKDARTIGKFLMANEEALSQVVISVDVQELRDLSLERESLSHLIAATKTEIKRILTTIFPELESIAILYTRVMIDFLKKYPSARLVKEAKPKAIEKAPKRKGVGTKLTYCADDIIQAARTSVAKSSPTKEVILRGKIATLEHLEGRLKEITELLTELCKSTMVEDFQIITSVKGINSKTAAPFLAELGSISNFSSYKKLIAYAGLDPSIHESGKFVGTRRLSKRGNRHLRRVVYLMTACVVQRDTVFKVYFERRKRAGMTSQKALFATAHKLIRVLFAMLTQRTFFQSKEVMHG